MVEEEQSNWDREVLPLYKRFWRLIYREWVGFLTPHQILILGFIAERTVRFGKTKELISRKQFIEGVFSSKGRTITRGLDISVSTLQRSLKDLLDLQIIANSRSSINKPQEYWINFEVLEKGPEFTEQNCGEFMTGKLKIPKNPAKTTRYAKNKGGFTHEPPGVHQRPPGGSPVTRISNIGFLKEDSKKVETITAPPIVGAVRTKIELVKQNSYEKRQQEFIKLNTTLTQKGVRLAWIHLYQKHYPDAPCSALSMSQYVKLKAGYKATSFPPDFSFVDFLDYTILNWKTIRDEEFHMMRSFPPLPDFPFFCAMFKRLLAIYSGHRISRRREIVRKEDNMETLSDLREQLSRAKEMVYNLKRALSNTVTEEDRTSVSLSSYDDVDDIPEWDKHNVH